LQAAASTGEVIHVGTVRPAVKPPVWWRSTHPG
jgi:hypothetical protein